MGRTVVSNTVIDCEGCGKLVQHSNMTAEPFPDGWFMLNYTYRKMLHQAEFCSPTCLVSWVTKADSQEERVQDEVFESVRGAGVTTVPIQEEARDDSTPSEPGKKSQPEG